MSKEPVFPPFLMMEVSRRPRPVVVRDRIVVSMTNRVLGPGRRMVARRHDDEFIERPMALFGGGSTL
jgi:hypothetical protein